MKNFYLVMGVSIIGNKLMSKICGLVRGVTMKLDVFIFGETIDLCIPTKEFAEISGWYSWLNDPRMSRYLYRGLFPNTAKDQVEFFQSQEDKRLTLIISDKRDYLGVVSLSHIDLVSKKASVAMLINPKIDFSSSFVNSSIMALEAIARITEYGFKAMGINRIWGGQHVDLSGWGQRMELLGYRVEGILIDEFVKGWEVANVIWVAATNNNYLSIVKMRGEYWDSAKKMNERILNLPKVKFSHRVNKFLDEEGSSYYDKILEL